jgi:hypothetical protein
MSPPQLNHGPTGLPLLEDGELLSGGNAPATDLGRWIWVHLHKPNPASQTVKISTGADHTASQLFFTPQPSTQWDCFEMNFKVH